MLELLLVVGRDALRRDAGDGRDDLLDLLTVIVFLRLLGGTSICIAPTSSITSIALSGSLRSLM
jgi:hypothetical protein